MRKQFQVFLVVLTLAVFASVYFFTKSEDLVIDEEGKAFDLIEFSNVDRIEMSQKAESISLVKVGNSWKVNGEALVLRDKADLLPKVFEGLKVKYAAPQEHSDSIRTSILKGGVHVTLFQEEELLKSFFVAPKTIDSSSIYGTLNNECLIYALYVLGEQINFEQFFSVNEGDWRSLRLWDFQSEKWTGVFYRSEQDSLLTYQLYINENKMELFQEGAPVQFDYGKAVDWIKDIGNRKAKAFIGNHLPEDLGLKIAEFTFSNGAIETAYEAFEKKAAKGATDLMGRNIEIDQEFFYLKRGQEVFLVDYFSFEPILQGIKAFQ